MKRMIAFTMIWAFAVGCSNDSGSGGGGPLGQRGVPGKISTAGAKALAGQTAILQSAQSQQQGRADDRRGGGRRMEFAALAALVEKSAPKESSQTRQETHRKSRRLNDALQRNQCRVDLEDAQDIASPRGGSPLFPRMKVRISGSACPLELNLVLDVSGDPNDVCKSDAQGATSCLFKGSLVLSYRVLDEGLRKEMEVSHGSISVLYDINQVMGGDQRGFRMNMKNAARFEVKAVDLEGRSHLITGLTDANLTMHSSMGSAQPGSPDPGLGFDIKGTARESIEYLDEASNTSLKLDGTLVFNGGSQPAATYLLNGQPVEEGVYMAEQEKLSNSMMTATPGQQQEEVVSSDPIENPNEGPITRPTPGPQPIEPAPMPPGPADFRYACVMESYDRNRAPALFIGYASTEAVAQSRVKIACQNAGAYCTLTPKCEEQRENPRAWYCEARNYSDNRLFPGEGRSRLEARYHARQLCVHASGSEAASCSNVYDRDCHQQ